MITPMIRFQLDNRVGTEEFAPIVEHLDEVLEGLLNQYEDEFLSGAEYLKAWDYVTEENGTVPYTN